MALHLIMKNPKWQELNKLPSGHRAETVKQDLTSGLTDAKAQAFSYLLLEL